MADDFGPDLGAPTADIAAGMPLEPGTSGSGIPKIIVIAAAVLGLLVVVGLVVTVVLFTLGKNAAEQAATNSLNASLNKPAAVASTGSVEPTGTQGNREIVPVSNKDVFTARDPFAPVLKPLPVVVATQSVPTTGSPDYNTLVLENIVTSNGALTAILKWNGATYTAVAGQQLDASPWKVLEITKTTVTMLYGDVQVTLSIGEGVAR